MLNSPLFSSLAQRVATRSSLTAYILFHGFPTSAISRFDSKPPRRSSSHLFSNHTRPISLSPTFYFLLFCFVLSTSSQLCSSKFVMLTLCLFKSLPDFFPSPFAVSLVHLIPDSNYNGSYRWQNDLVCLGYRSMVGSVILTTACRFLSSAPRTTSPPDLLSTHTV